MEGNTALGASSPANPAFTRPEPLSQTRAVVSSSSHMLAGSGGAEDCEFEEPENKRLSIVIGLFFSDAEFWFCLQKFEGTPQRFYIA